jgi:hypothetical protein
MLRMPVRLTSHRTPAVRLGVVPGYPRTLAEQRELKLFLHPGEGEHAGAMTLREQLHTLPVHDFITERDVEAIRMWLDACDTNH